MTPTYASPCGRVRLYNADALDVLPTLPSGSIAGVVADPPYSSGGFTRSDKAADPSTKYCQHGQTNRWANFTGDNRDQRSYLYWSDLWMRRALDLLRPRGYFLCFTDWRQLPITTDALQSAGVVWRGIVPWNKGLGSRAPHKGYFRHQCEYVVWGTHGSIEKLTHDGPFAGCITAAHKRADKQHLCGKPTALMEELLRFGRPGETIL